MAKFLNKKEQVIDFQLTPYGKRKLATGTFKPIYYSFYDEGIIYDGEYAGLTEAQNKIHERIKNNTQYLEGILSFEELENSVPPSVFIGATLELGDILRLVTAGVTAGMSAAEIEVISTRYTELILAGAYAAPSVAGVYAYEIISSDVRPDKLQFQSEIGDAYFDSENQQAAPAWKIVTCQGNISKSSVKDPTLYYPSVSSSIEYDIPQVDVDVHYTKKVTAPTAKYETTSIANTINTTKKFSDGNIIELVRDDLTVYMEELNTELLTENFDIEVFEVTPASFISCDDDAGCDVGTKCISGRCAVPTTIERKFFEKQDPQVVDGIMIRARTEKELTSEPTTELTETGVEYYFDVLTDRQVYPKIACRCVSTFNKESYYIDLDFDCEEEEEALFYDIYGSVAVPEICAPSNTDNTDFDDDALTPIGDVCEDE